MKTLTLFSIWILSFQLSLAQEFYNFHWSGSGLEWQKVYSSNGSPDSLMKAIIKSNSLKSYKIIDDSTLIGEMINVKGICEGTKSVHSWATRTAYTKGTLYGTAKIDFKIDKYRVTIYGITIDPRLNLEDNENKEAIEGWYWNPSKGDFKTGNYRDDDLMCFDNGLFVQFSIKQEKDW